MSSADIPLASSFFNTDSASAFLDSSAAFFSAATFFASALESSFVATFNADFLLFNCSFSVLMLSDSAAISVSICSLAAVFSATIAAFQSATQRAGFGLSFNQSHAKWKIACIATAFAEYRQHGERIYTDALRVLAEAWEGDIDSLRSEVLQGVVRFVALYDHEYDPIRLIKQLKRTSPLTIYRSGQAMSGPNCQKYMHQILKAYNGSSRSKSLPIKQ